MNEKLFSIEELSGYLNIPKSTIYKLSQSKEIPSIKIGKQLRFRKSSIDLWLSRGEEKGFQPAKSGTASYCPGRSILLVDDDELVLKGITRFLSSHGYCVETAMTGEDAVTKTQSKDFDLVITDVRMPGIDGIQMLREIRQMNTEKNKLLPKEIIITGYADPEVEKEAEALNIEDYLYKPFETKQFIDAVRKKLDKTAG